VTDVSSRPMATPDLANLLKRPSRAVVEPRAAAERPRPAPVPHEVVAPDTTTTVDQPRGDDAPAAEETEHEPQGGIQADPPASVPSGQDEPGSERKQRQARRASADAASRESPQSSGRQYLRIKSIYLPRSLHQRLGQQAISRKTTRTALILTAVNQTHSRLGSYLATETASSGGGGHDDLFDIPQHRKDAEPAVQTTIRVTDRQHQAIENLVAELGTNRSRLVAAALTLYLV
jgi:chemotaxis protein histidine kinase CheA